MLSDRSYQVRNCYWLWRSGYMDRRTALGLLSWIRRGHGMKMPDPSAVKPEVSAETTKELRR